MQIKTVTIIHVIMVSTLAIAIVTFVCFFYWLRLDWGVVRTCDCHTFEYRRHPLLGFLFLSFLLICFIRKTWFAVLFFLLFMVKKVRCYHSWNFPEIFKHRLSWISRFIAWQNRSVIIDCRWCWAILTIHSHTLAGINLAADQMVTIFSWGSKHRVSVAFIQSFLWCGSTKRLNN